MFKQIRVQKPDALHNIYPFDRHITGSNPHTHKCWTFTHERPCINCQEEHSQIFTVQLKPVILPFRVGHFGGNPPHRRAEGVWGLLRASCTRSLRCGGSGPRGRASGQAGEDSGMEAYPAPRVAAVAVTQFKSWGRESGRLGPPSLMVEPPGEIIRRVGVPTPRGYFGDYTLRLWAAKAADWGHHRRWVSP